MCVCEGFFEFKRVWGRGCVVRRRVMMDEVYVGGFLRRRYRKVEPRTRVFLLPRVWGFFRGGR